MAIFLIILAVTLCLYIGYRCGVVFIKKENRILERQNALLEKFSSFWSHQAAPSTDLIKSITQQHTNNLSHTMDTVIHLLTLVQKEQQQSLSPTDQQRLNSIISQAQMIGPASSVEDERFFQ